MSNVKFDFTGENFVVTGASSGMGRQVALELAQSGAKVLIIARREDRLRELQAQFPSNVFVAPLDVCNSEQMECAIQEFVAINGKLHGGVHAAGIADITPIKSYDKIRAKEIMNVNFWSGMDFVQTMTKKKISNEEASFVFFSSVYAISSAKGMFAYSGAKAAIISAMRSISKEISKRGQRINAILPGWVKSEMTEDLGSMSNKSEIIANELLGVGSPKDVSGMALFLLSNRACWITGTSIAVDGGFLA